MSRFGGWDTSDWVIVVLLLIGFTALFVGLAGGWRA